MSDNTTNNTTDAITANSKILAKSIKNLRENLTNLSLDSFLKNTLETAYTP